MGLSIVFVHFMVASVASFFRFREIGGLHADRVDEASRDLVLGVGCSWHRDHA